MTGTNYPNYFGAQLNSDNGVDTRKDWWKLFGTGIGVNPSGNMSLIPGGGLVKGLGAIGTGFADLIGSRNRIEEQQGYLGEAQKGIEDFYGSYKRGAFDPKMSQSIRDAYSFGMRKPDTSGIQSSTQTALGAASSDPRLLGGMIGNIQKNQAQLMNQQNQMAADKQQAQLMGLGQAEQSILDRQTDLDRSMAMMKYGEDYASKQQALQNIETLKQQKRDAFGNILSGITNVGLGIAGMPSYPEAEGGMKTPGEFSHETNPIHMMDKNGNKVGEATGGEYILNPDQSDMIEDAYENINEKMSSGKTVTKADLMALYDVVRGVFSQEQFQD